jgi:hypothetical protein
MSRVKVAGVVPSEEKADIKKVRVTITCRVTTSEKLTILGCSAEQIPLGKKWVHFSSKYSTNEATNSVIQHRHVMRARRPWRRKSLRVLDVFRVSDIVVQMRYVLQKNSTTLRIMAAESSPSVQESRRMPMWSQHWWTVWSGCRHADSLLVENLAARATPTRTARTTDGRCQTCASACL